MTKNQRIGAKLRFAAVLCALAQWGCADLTVLAPGPSVEPPEVTARHMRWGLEAGMSTGRNLTVVENAGARPPNFSKPEEKSGVYVPVGGTLGVVPRVQVGLGIVEILPMEFGGYFKAQWQVLGDGVEVAKRGNLPLSLFVKASSTGDSNSGDQSVTFGAGGFPWRARASLYTSELGVSMGYRPIEDLLLFIGGVRGWYDGKTEITQDKAGADPGGTYVDTYHGQASSAAMGLTFGKDVRVSVSAAYYDVRIGTMPAQFWTSTNILAQWYLGSEH